MVRRCVWRRWPPQCSRSSRTVVLIGLNFRNVLGDALCDERGLARRLSRIARRSSRHCCSSRIGSPAANTCRSYRPFRGGSRRWRRSVGSSSSTNRVSEHPIQSTTDAPTTLEQWADSITAVLDDLGSREAVLIASNAAFAPAALFAATHPSRTTALIALDGIRRPTTHRRTHAGGILRCHGRRMGNGRVRTCAQS